jgi:hypothetical protein
VRGQAAASRVIFWLDVSLARKSKETFKLVYKRECGGSRIPTHFFSSLVEVLVFTRLRQRIPSCCVGELGLLKINEETDELENVF